MNEEDVDFTVENTDENEQSKIVEEAKTDFTVSIPNDSLMKKINSKEFQHVMKSKQDVFSILSREG